MTARYQARIRTDKGHDCGFANTAGGVSSHGHEGTWFDRREDCIRCADAAVDGLNSGGPHPYRWSWSLWFDAN